MSRIPVTLREAVVADAGFLAELWQDSIRRADRREQIADLEGLVKAAAESAETRILVALYDGLPAGAVMLRITTVTPLNLEPALQVLHPHVAPDFRRRGVGRALMDGAVAFAEDRGLAQVVTGAQAASRDGNRFLARLGMAQHAVLRVGPTHTVRSKLNAQHNAQLPAAERQRYRPQRVLAVRRSMRRTQSAG